jgi:hypothetical protein
VLLILQILVIADYFNYGGKNKNKKMIKNKKGQMKIQEMAFVLLAVVFLFALLFLFFARFQFVQMNERAEEVREARTITMLRVVSSMPELRCSRSFGSTTEVYCIDKDKLDAFSITHIKNKYTSIWQSSHISEVVIEEVYGGKERYFIYKSANEPENYFTYSTYIPLCEETIGNLKCVVAKIKITTINV